MTEKEYAEALMTLVQNFQVHLQKLGKPPDHWEALSYSHAACLRFSQEADQMLSYMLRPLVLH